MKTCFKCDKQKEDRDFELRKDSGKLRGVCRVCVKAHIRALYRAKAQDREFCKKKNERARIVQAALRRPKREYVNGIKEATPCADCGRRFPAICMDFDHRPGTVKVAGGVARLTGSGKGSLEQIKLEIEKCDIVCACCHRLRTQSRKDYNKAREISLGEV